MDVLHHTSNARILLREAARVSRRYIVIKDHPLEGPFAKATLQAMDWIGNYGHDVVLPYNYLSEQEWREYFRDTNLSPEHWTESLGLYPFPFLMKLHKRSIALSCPAGTDTCGRAGDRSVVHRFGAAPFFVIGVGAIFFLIPAFINGFPLVFSDSVDYLVYTPIFIATPSMEFSYLFFIRITSSGGRFCAGLDRKPYDLGARSDIRRSK